jgi:hypothetical protein
MKTRQTAAEMPYPLFLLNSTFRRFKTGIKNIFPDSRRLLQEYIIKQPVKNCYLTESVHNFTWEKVTTGITLGCGFAALTRYYRKCRTKRMKTRQTAAEMPQSFCVMSGSCGKKSNSLTFRCLEWKIISKFQWHSTIKMQISVSIYYKNRHYHHLIRKKLTLAW